MIKLFPILGVIQAMTVIIHTKKGRSNHSVAHCIRNTIFSITTYPG
ncbi:MAG TPA: hypothetical protein VD905_21355 [Flavobacteriales bacterium]|nr:hypothetical protein [Flavobacteriales bacterium]